LLLALAVSIGACDASFGPARGAGRGGAAGIIDTPDILVPVEITQPRRGDIASYFETTSRVEAERRVDVAAKSSARCTKRYAEVGDRVAAGDILAELDKAEAQANYNQTAVQMRQNQTAYEVAKSQFEQGLGPKVEMENARYAYEQSLATLETQKIHLENLTVRAPISGIVTARTIQEGMLVSAGQTVYSIVDPSSFIIAISPPERELPRLEVGQRAKITIDALRGREFDASIRRINPSVDPVSGTIKVILDFDEDLRDRLHESAFARVKLVMATMRNVLLIPKEAIVEEDARQYVFLARQPDRAARETADSDALVEQHLAAPKDELPPAEYEAVRVAIRTGLEDADRIQVMGQLTEDDYLIVNGQHTLRDGARVRITNLRDAIHARDDLPADQALAEAVAAREAGSGADTGPDRP